jgi:hypothetical protein
MAIAMCLAKLDYHNDDLCEAMMQLAYSTATSLISVSNAPNHAQVAKSEEVFSRNPEPR